MYFPYLRGRQFELIALRELVENNCISEKVIPIIEPVKLSSTLIRTLDVFAKKNRLIALIMNPSVGDFSDIEKNNSDVLGRENIIKAYIINKDIVEVLKKDCSKDRYLIVNQNRDSLDNYLSIYEDSFPSYTLIPDDRAFKRVVSNARVLFEDRFNKVSRNIDYLKNEDEFFSDDHLYFKDEGFLGFSDYSIVGEEFNKSGFAPIAVAIHIVYFDKQKVLRIHHFVSDSNLTVKDVSGKFGEALSKLVLWCDNNDVRQTLGLKGLLACYKEGKYPGLGVVKKYSIMHHLELVSSYLGGFV